ncbi:hypothetical protein PENDEC_c002G06728 [Penicillium decumbens]|uniref:Uncharacterized protein n=1 Tax=Penicillium decumbens TaxID=69771 RepID=A0A1V6PLJ9_PENDC|nr:hypothetical protein PENDEC_c002G06728 [Penicillium decumbens]
MGNICSRSSNKPEGFSGPGRVVGAPATSPSAPRAPVPAKNWKNTPGRTLGESSETQGSADDARSNAAIAAQKRAEEASGNKGKLGSKLAAQKAKTQTQTLGEVSREERAARDADGAEEARRWQ